MIIYFKVGCYSMDEFLREINATVFWQYIKNYHYKNNMQVELQGKSVVIKTAYSHSEINSYDLQIFEFKVFNTYKNEDEFYLHFQMKNMKHALELFEEMLEIIETLVQKPKTRVLLSCSGGLTTGFFAMKLNESVKILDEDYLFDAIAFDQLKNVAKDYDIILLAPQISYQHAKVQEQFPNKIVLKIPTRVFAKYDTSKMLNLIAKTRIKEYKKKHEDLTLGEITRKHGEILTLALIRNSVRIHVGYRLFGRNNDILEDGEIIKTYLTIDDICDVIDTMMLHHKHIDAIAIATPGIINDGIVDTMKLEGMDDGTNIKAALKQRYRQKIILCNDVNSVAIGYHACQNTYHNISVIFQPVGTNAGIGNIINDRLHVGNHSLSGEVQYMPLVLSKSRFELNKTAEGTVELLAQIVLLCTVTVAPELVVICNGLLDVNKLKKELYKYLPKDYCPKIVKIDYLQDYSFIGSFIQAIRECDGD